MHLSLRPPINNTQVYVKGDVSIDESAAIAPGVIMQADPDSKIVIAAGVCIGMGSILHAHKGKLEVGAGAILGAGVLVIGALKIGENTCIGAATTIWNSSVKPSQVIAAGSVLGDRGRSIAEAEETPTTEDTAENDQALPAKPEAKETPAIENPASNNGASPPKVEEDPVPPEAPLAPVAESEPQNGLSSSSASDAANTGISVYGQANLNRLLSTLFPHAKIEPSHPEDED